MLRDDIDEFLKEIPRDVRVVAATKYVGPNEMLELFSHGVHDFAENRVDALLMKQGALEAYPITWHFIGHLQRNKCKEIINKIDYLHSLDSLELAKMIDKERLTPLPCFIEVSVNMEESKNGVPFKELNSFMEEVLKYKNITVVGFMMMAIKNSDDLDCLKQFKALAYLRNRVEKDFNIKLPYLSMGMSDDYKSAIKAGSTHVRLGRILWKL